MNERWYVCFHNIISSCNYNNLDFAGSAVIISFLKNSTCYKAATCCTGNGLQAGMVKKKNKKWYCLVDRFLPSVHMVIYFKLGHLLCFPANVPKI